MVFINMIKIKENTGCDKVFYNNQYIYTFKKIKCLSISINLTQGYLYFLVPIPLTQTPLPQLLITPTQVIWHSITNSKTWYPFSILGPQPGDHITFSSYVFLSSFWLWEFSRLSLFVITVLKSTSLVFCRMSLSWDLSDVLFMCLGGKPKGSKSHSYYSKSDVHAINRTCYYCCESWSPG